MLLKLCRSVAPKDIYQMVHILMLLWQHARFQSLPLENKILPFVAALGKIYSKKCSRGDPMKVGLACVLDKTSRKF